MKAIKKKPATLADIAALPEHLLGELVAGEMSATPRPRIGHAIVAGALGDELRGPFHRGKSGPGGWWIVGEPELHFGADVVVPDLAGWRKERLPVMQDVPFLEVPPDWACEISSPTTARFDRVVKLPLYLRVGVSFVWLVDPVSRTIEALRSEGGRWILAGNFVGEDRARIAPFEAHELDLGSVWLPSAEE